MSNVPERERGFVLLAVLWLLMLAGSMAALMMQRSAENRRSLQAAAQHLGDDLVLRSAVETFAAERLFDEARGQWGTLPASGTINIDSWLVEARAVSEAQFVDINAADFPVIDEVATRAGLSASERAALLAALKQRREAGKPIAAYDELASLLSERGDRCWTQTFSLTSGTANMGQPPLVPFRAEPIRLTMAFAGARTTYVLRATGDVVRPMMVTARFRAGIGCTAVPG